MGSSNEFLSMEMEESDEYGRREKKPGDGKLNLLLLLSAAMLCVGILTLFIVFYQQRKFADMESSMRSLNCSVRFEMNADSQKNMLSEINTSVSKLTSSVNSLSSKIQNTDERVMKLQSDLTDLKTRLEKNDRSISLCKSGWIPFRSKCYFFSKDLMNWYEARNSCRSENGMLVKVETEEELTFLFNENDRWIGLTDENTGEWRWDDGSPFVRNSDWWNEGQPDNWDGHGLGGGEDCGHLTEYGKLNDNHCSVQMKYICQI